MNSKRLPVAAIAALLTLGVSMPAYAQSAGLPKTSLGRVGQPGDNQYTPETQHTRHAVPVAPAPMANVPPPIYGAPWQPTPRPPRADPSIEPIAADEPIAPAGFPPLPDRLELPAQVGWAPGGGGGGGGAPSMGGGGGGGWGGGGGGGGPASMGRPIDRTPTMREHYNNFAPGAFMPAGGAGNGSSARVRTPEQFATRTGPPRAQETEAQMALRRLGQEPNLRQDDTSTQTPPQAVSISQSTTQDLSSPEDDFQRKSTPLSSSSAPSAMGRAGKRMGRMVINRAYSMGSSGMGMMSSGMHF